MLLDESCIFLFPHTPMEKLIGRITHYYKDLGVASVYLEDMLEVGDLIHVIGHTTNYDQEVESLEIMHRRVNRVGKGEVAGLKVNGYVRSNDLVYRIIP